MSWTELEPIVRTVPNAKASINVTKQGAKLWMSFSEPFFREIGQPNRANVMGGAGESAGKVRLVFAKDGKFEVQEFGSGGARIIMPIFTGVPDGARDQEPCTVESSSKSEAVIALPLAAWEAQINQPAPKAPVQPKPAPAAATQATKPAARVKIVPYLQGKGHDVSRRVSGDYTVDGKVMSKTQVLGLINGHRRERQLPSLGLDEIE